MVGLLCGIDVGKVENDVGCWMKLTEECLVECCVKPTNQGYVLCYNEAAKKTLIQDLEV